MVYLVIVNAHCLRWRHGGIIFGHLVLGDTMVSVLILIFKLEGIPRVVLALTSKIIDRINGLMCCDSLCPWLCVSLLVHASRRHHSTWSLVPRRVLLVYLASSVHGVDHLLLHAVLTLIDIVGGIEWCSGLPSSCEIVTLIHFHITSKIFNCTEIETVLIFWSPIVCFFELLTVGRFNIVVDDVSELTTYCFTSE